MPFGFGLSYTSFLLCDAKVKTTAKDQVTCSVQVQNTGNRRGGEVAQLYISWKGSVVDRPVKHLMDFGKVYLEAGEAAGLELTVLKEDLAYSNEMKRCFVEENINYEAYISNSSDLSEISPISFHFQSIGDHGRDYPFPNRE